ncbi:MAG: hypothetical protein CME57_03155 [Halieaceae bacterium]|nr:hypothetical protein [Halieaceae bacterium]
MLSSTHDAISAAKAGDHSTACSLLDQCIDEEDDPAGLFQAALCYRASKRLNDALRLLKVLEDRGQTRPPAVLLRADIFCALDRHHHAIPLYGALANIEDANMRYAAASGFFQCGDVETALSLTQSICDSCDQKLASQAILLRGRCEAACENYRGAADAFSAVAGPPSSKRAADFRLARLALHQGQFPEALSRLTDLTKVESNEKALPDVHESLLQAYIHSGQTNAALDLIETKPAAAGIHWLRHATELLCELNAPDPLRLMRAKWVESGDPAIFRELLSRHLSLGEKEAAQDLVNDYAEQHSKDVHWRWGHLHCLAESGGYEEILAHQIAGPDSALELVCQAHFALGHYSEALSLAQQLCQTAPGDQYHLALLVTALRCLNDDRSVALINLEQLVFETTLPAPGNPTEPLASAWDTVAAALANHHRMRSAPPTQSVQNGLQTPGNLLTQTSDTSLMLLKESLDSAASTFFDTARLRHLADAHPLKLFRPKRPMMHASWAILGTASTFHRAHVHTKGWYSGTIYAEVPSTVIAGDDAGHLVLGEPPFQTKDPLPPLATIQPKTGKMVLFPSYLWHGTRPYSGDERRQVVAFDYGEPNRFV